MDYADDGDLLLKVKEKLKMAELMKRDDSKESFGLRNYLTLRDEGYRFSEDEVWSIAIQMIMGLKALHDKSILHRDLKSANIFCYKNGAVKLGDLNVSKIMKEQMSFTQTGTPYYASPEIWRDKPYDFKSDVWSLGIIIYEVAMLSVPFKAVSIEELYKNVLRGVYSPIHYSYSLDLHDLITCIIQVDPKKRPSCNEILAMPIVQEKMKKLGFAQFDSKYVDLSPSKGFKPSTVRQILNPLNSKLLPSRLPYADYGSEQSMRGKSPAEQTIDTVDLTAREIRAYPFKKHSNKPILK